MYRCTTLHPTSDDMLLPGLGLLHQVLEGLESEAPQFLVKVHSEPRHHLHQLRVRHAVREQARDGRYAGTEQVHLGLPVTTAMQRLQFDCHAEI